MALVLKSCGCGLIVVGLLLVFKYCLDAMLWLLKRYPDTWEVWYLAGAFVIFSLIAYFVLRSSPDH